MSDSVEPGPADADLDAAEYVLGTLDVTERAAFAARLASDAATRQAVARWERHFTDLAATADPVAPPPGVWESIERALRTERLTVIEGGRTGAAAPSVLRPDFRASRNRWRLATLASGALAAALAVFVVVRQPAPIEPSSDVYVAAVNRGGDKPALIVRVDLAAHTVVVRPVAAQPPAGKSLELWYIDAGQAPKSMGVLDNDTETLPIPADAKGDAATFAVSVEPQGGSTTGAPTGPVVYSGQLVKE